MAKSSATRFGGLGSHITIGFNSEQIFRLEAHGMKEANVLFNNALNTFYLWLYGLEHMVKDYSDSEREKPLPPLHGLFFPISSKSYFISHRIANVMVFVIPVV